MKSTKTLLMLMTLLTSLSLNAQTKTGLTAGVIFANVTAKFQGISVSPKTRAGITVGLFTDCRVSSNLSFQPAINFVQKGYRVKDETSSGNLCINYLEVPLNFVFHKKGFFMGTGPSLAFGISGKEKFVDSQSPTGEPNTKIKFGSGDEEIKRLDLGANFLTGYNWANGFLFSLNYNPGLNNIQNGSTTDVGKIKNRYFAIRLGYELNSSKHR